MLVTYHFFLCHGYYLLSRGPPMSSYTSSPPPCERWMCSFRVIARLFLNVESWDGLHQISCVLKVSSLKCLLIQFSVGENMRNFGWFKCFHHSLLPRTDIKTKGRYQLLLFVTVYQQKLLKSKQVTGVLLSSEQCLHLNSVVWLMLINSLLL